MSHLQRATISGSFKAADGEIESYDRVVGIIPALDEDKSQQMIIKRYAKIWIGQATMKDSDEPKYKRVLRVREVFIDNIEDAEDLAGKTLSYVGKDIMEMNYEELQDLAAAKDLAAIPLYKTGSLSQARRVAFAEYGAKVLGWTEFVVNPKTGKSEELPISWQREGFNPKNFETIRADGIIRRSDEHVADIEETLDRENLNDQVKSGKIKSAAREGSRLSMDQLKAIAKDKGISFNANISYDKLYDRIYKETVAA